jgi:phosphate transport system protein
MLASAVSSLLEADVHAAEGVRGANKGIDALYREILHDSVVFMSQHPTEVASTMSSMSVAKCLDRIADHAANIAEATLFVVLGEPMPC